MNEKETWLEVFAHVVMFTILAACFIQVVNVIFGADNVIYWIANMF